jgi:hypothetical protein
VVEAALATDDVIAGTAGDVVTALAAVDGVVAAAAVDGHAQRRALRVDDVVAGQAEFTTERDNRLTCCR